MVEKTIKEIIEDILNNKPNINNIEKAISEFEKPIYNPSKNLTYEINQLSTKSPNVTKPRKSSIFSDMNYEFLGGTIGATCGGLGGVSLAYLSGRSYGYPSEAMVVGSVIFGIAGALIFGAIGTCITSQFKK